MEGRRQQSRGLEVIVSALESEVCGLNRLLIEIDKRNAQQFVSQERAVAAGLAAAEKAVGVAERNAEKWRDNANEWRGAMTDKDRNFVTKNALWGYAVGMVGLVLTLILILEKVRP
jgi:hypothetical protein